MNFIFTNIEKIILLKQYVKIGNVSYFFSPQYNPIDMLEECDEIKMLKRLNQNDLNVKSNFNCGKKFITLFSLCT